MMLTGATGRIGGAFARRVLAAGGKVAAVVRRPWQVAKVQQELGAANVLVGVVGPQDTEAAAGFVKGAQDALGAITAFVGCAGSRSERVAGREPQGDLAEQLEANLQANATVCRAVLSGMRRRRRGVITFVGAAVGVGAGVNHLAAKAALAAYAQQLQLDVLDGGIAVHCVQQPTAESVLDELARLLVLAPTRVG
ncbi:MAG: SDR family NAD(P)-dependent oxidoreductase [Planctomycetes bacterium]|nr:SDR family NAD(P)-dependent oxidoreductase [Planctomycetota bacterium]